MFGQVLTGLLVGSEVDLSFTLNKVLLHYLVFFLRGKLEFLPNFRAASYNFISAYAGLRGTSTCHAAWKVRISFSPKLLNQ